MCLHRVNTHHTSPRTLHTMHTHTLTYARLRSRIYFVNNARVNAFISMCYISLFFLITRDRMNHVYLVCRIPANSRERCALSSTVLVCHPRLILMPIYYSTIYLTSFHAQALLYDFLVSITVFGLVMYRMTITSSHMMRARVRYPESSAMGLQSRPLYRLSDLPRALTD